MQTAPAMIRVKPETRDRLKSLAGDTAIHKYIDTLLNAVSSGSQVELDAVRGEFTFADVKRSIDALRKTFESRMDAQDKEIAKLSSHLEWSNQYHSRLEDKILCNELGIDYLKEHELYINEMIEEHIKMSEESPEDEQDSIFYYPEIDGSVSFRDWVLRKSSKK